jgi:hypothetical protein
MGEEVLVLALLILFSILSTALTWFKGSEYWGRVKDTRWATAVSAVDAAVTEVYENYVRDLKNGREDGKLTDEERREARDRALSLAIDIGKTRGVDVMAEIGTSFVRDVLEDAVQKRKVR